MPGKDINADVYEGTSRQDPSNPAYLGREDLRELFGASPNGGFVFAERRRFVESAAGTHTASVDLPAGAVLLDILIFGEVLWAAGTSATLKVGDAADDDGYFVGVNLKATDLLANEQLSFAFTGGKDGAYINQVGSETSPVGSIERQRVFVATGRRITGVVTQVGTGTAGRTHMTVLYTVPTVVDAVYAA